jgi:hypothetical protein
MKPIGYLFTFILFTINAMGQYKTFTLDDLIPGGETYSQFTPKTDYSVKWKGDNLLFSDEKGNCFIANPNHPDEKRPLNENEKEKPAPKEEGWKNIDF